MYSVVTVSEEQGDLVTVHHTDFRNAQEVP